MALYSSIFFNIACKQTNKLIKFAQLSLHLNAVFNINYLVALKSELQLKE